ncbi:MAG: type I-C CRISPR-associated protein Cas8c/Csd1 [Alicyclobacillus sp.]|nr:type I-C CRISPR-associated protein Cas8c/Csd1 [Alicyclobacillus sp.]
MILETLRNLTPQDSVPSYYKPQVVKWIIHLTEAGKFLRMDDVRREEPRKTLALPINGRSSDISARVAADDASYVLPYGLYQTEKKESLMRQRHEDFLRIMRMCGERSQQIRSILAFLESGEVAASVGKFKEEIKEKDIIAFMVAGEYVGTQPEIVRFWAEHNMAKNLRPHNLYTEEVKLCCMICGMPIDAVIDAYVFQGVAGGSKVSMIPWKEDALYAQSYGWVQGENSPICAVCSDAITRNYNDLHLNASIKLGGIEYTIMSKQREAVKTNLNMLVRPTKDGVRALLALEDVRVESQRHLEYDAHYWLLYATAPSPGRGHFFGREYMLNETRDRVLHWLEAQSIEGGTREDDDKQYFSIGSLLSHLYLMKKDQHTENSVPDRMMDAVFHAVLSGNPLPRYLLVLAVQRNKAEMRVSRQRAILINLMLEQIEGVSRMGLDPTETNKGYLLGRVLSLISQAQYHAIGKVNAPVSARFWSGFSTAPAVSFPRLMALYNQYRNKLLKEKSNVAVSIDQQLSEVLALIGTTCPNRLSLEEQAAFALGYYYQEAQRYKGKTAKDNRSETSAEDNNS